MDLFVLQTLLPTLLVLFFIYILRKKSPKKNLPPSPPTLPIIGNLHQLGNIIHRSLYELSRKHGPLMLLYLGSKPTLVVSSRKAAEEVMRKHDLACASKPDLSIPKRFFYGLKDLINLRYGEDWKKLNRVFVQEFVNSQKVKSYAFIREEETALLVGKIEKACLTSTPVNLTDMFAAITNDKICRAAFGKTYTDTEMGKRFLKVMDDAVFLMFKFNIGEFVPWLEWTNSLTGFNAEVEKTVAKIDEMLESVIQDHLEKRSLKTSDQNETFMDVLLGLYKGSNPDITIDRTYVKALLLDVFGAGTETSAATLGWAMTELLRHPEIMKKVKNEIRQVLNGKLKITDEDIDKMPYLKAVLKETFRYHPPGPIYFHQTREDVNLMGYDVAADTMIIINAWAIGRDPDSWKDPDKFMPDRFLNSSVDFRGASFQLVPFGAGRRICPGLGFAAAAIEHVLANLIYRFEWELPGGTKVEDLDTVERPGFTVGREYPLIAIPTKSYF